MGASLLAVAKSIYYFLLRLYMNHISGKLAVKLKL